MGTADFLVTVICIIIVVYIIYCIYKRSMIEEKPKIIPSNIHKEQFNDKLTNDQVKAIANLVTQNQTIVEQK
ncbi:IMV membrane protein [Sea otter poxvirus]|uniref:IMV membrane protein n=1 Tax=Sea otter poxvirus TaxID=1416741 RepID=A0A2U9QHU6_9POXV|nr:IMV membrane protein [Sea otter poxvirus]AWU47147.1 IMV membrane protein [Sea otter poxvirus]